MNDSKRNRTRRFCALVVLTLVGGLVSSACGVSNSNSHLKANDTAGSSGTGATGTTGGEGNTPVGGEGNTPVGGEGNTPTPCKEGDKQCNADGITPQICDANGAWQDDPNGPCGGTTPVCNAGTCAAYRLVNAGIDSFGVRTDPVTVKGGAQIVLKEQTLSAAPRACGTVKGKQICVTGGIR